MQKNEKGNKSIFLFEYRIYALPDIIVKQSILDANLA
jgi:hypothetical protein